MNNKLLLILFIIGYLILVKNNKIKESFHYLYPNRFINRLYPLYMGVHRYLRDTSHYNQKYYYDPYLNRYYTYDPLTETRNYRYNNLPYFSYPLYRTNITYRREYS